MSRGNTWGIGILLFTLMLALQACGGGGTDAAVNIGGDTNPPVMAGEVTAPPAAGDYPVYLPAVEGVFENAPLGTNPDYNVTPGGGEEISHGVSKVSSDLNPDEQFRLDWIAVTVDLEEGVTPEHLVGFSSSEGINQGPFEEGAAVDFWLAYEVASGNTLHREWRLTNPSPDYSIELFDDEVTYLAGSSNEPGVKLVKFNYILPVGSAGLNTLEIVLTNGPKAGSVIIVVDPITFSTEMSFDVLEIPTSTNDYPPALPPQDDPPDCMPEWIIVDFISETVVDVESEKELSNVVLQFEDYTQQKFEDLTGYADTFQGTGEYEGKILIGVWVKSGCNASGDGPGYGEYFPAAEKYRHATMVWEDLISNSDYDYNDMVASMHAEEIYSVSGDLIQVNLMVKALARGAGYAADWQFNVESALETPGAEVQAIVKQYYASGTVHGEMRLWNSGMEGLCVPVFAPTIEALPVPPDHSFATNVVPGTTYIEGDYAEVVITFNPPLAPETYDHWPYDPELRVRPFGATSESGIYVVKMWRDHADNALRLDSNGRPLAFIVPDTFAWPLERCLIESCFPTFMDWVAWINNGGVEPSPLWSETEPVENSFNRSLFN